MTTGVGDAATLVRATFVRIWPAAPPPPPPPSDEFPLAPDAAGEPLAKPLPPPPEPAPPRPPSAGERGAVGSGSLPGPPPPPPPLFELGAPPAPDALMIATEPSAIELPATR